MPRRLLVLVATYAALSASPSLAQTVASAAELQPGVKVRVVAPGIVAGRYVGTILSRSGDTLTLGSPTAPPITLPSSRIQSLEISRGKSRADGAVRGIVWGVPIGMALGALLIGSEDCPNCAGNRGEVGPGQALGSGGLAGLAWGALIGALIGREHWDRFDLQHRTALGISPGRASFAVRYEF